MDNNPLRDLLCCIIEQAVADRRWAVTKGLLDKEANPLPNMDQRVKADRYGPWVSLHHFFYKGGIEAVRDLGDLDLPIEKIKKISQEPYDD